MNDGASREGRAQRLADIVLPREIDGQTRIEESVIGPETDSSRFDRMLDMLRESEARFREFAEASSDVLWIRDVETMQWEYLSPAFEAVYGISREAALTGNILKKHSLNYPSLPSAIILVI